MGFSFSRNDEARDRVAIRGGYLTSPNRADIVIGTTEFSPFRGRWGGVRVVAARSETLREGRPVRFDPTEEAWTAPTPPVRSGTTTRIGVAYVLDRGGYNDPVGTVRFPIDLLIEGWREGESYEIRRHAGSASLALGSRRLRGAVRGVVAETGFLDIEGTPPLRSSYFGGRVEGVVRRRTATIRLLEFQWRGEIDRSQGWDDGVPDAPTWEQRYRGGIATRGVLRRVAFEYKAPLTTTDNGEQEISSALRCMIPIGSAPDGSAPALTATSELSFTTSLEFTERSVSWKLALDRTTNKDRRGKLSWRLHGEEENEGWEWTHSYTLSIPFGRTAEVEGRCTVASYGTPDGEITGSVRLRWYRSGEAPRKRRRQRRRINRADWK